MDQDDIDAFEKLKVQLNSLYSEISSLAKKAPNSALNEFKIKFVNSTLERANRILGDEHKPFPDFEIFSAAEMPSNSDAAFILGQYIECVETYRSANIHKGPYQDWYWNLDVEDDEEEGVRTTPPKRLDGKR